MEDDDEDPLRINTTSNPPAAEPRPDPIIHTLPMPLTRSTSASTELSNGEQGTIRHQQQLCVETSSFAAMMSEFKCVICGTIFDDTSKLQIHLARKHKDVKPFCCEYCGKVFATTKTLNAHLQIQHIGRVDRYLCIACKAYFTSATDLLDHNAYVHKKTIQCSQCVKCFGQASKLTTHERSHSLHNSFSSEQCDENFMSESSLSLHVNRVDESKAEFQIHCILCDESFSKESNANDHVFVHADDGTFECPDCSDLFDDLTIFMDHMKTHDNKSLLNIEKTNDADNTSVNDDDNVDELHDFVDDFTMDDGDNRIDDNDLTKLGVTLSYKCPICDKIYEDVTEFNAHCENHKLPVEVLSPNVEPESKPKDERVTTKKPRVPRAPVSLKWQETDNKIRNYSCDKCDRSFTMASTLSLHMRRTHLGIKPYKCQVCEWAFAQSSDLIKHVRKHTGEKPYSCSTCGARFTQNRNLRNHMKIHTDEPSICKYCKKKFLIDTSLVQHLKKHEGPNMVFCSVCNIPFADQSYLDKHNKRCAKKEKHHCQMCDKSFFKSGDLIKHNRKHTGERPYVCNICNKTFSHPTSLRNHNAVHTKSKPFICSYCGQAFSFHGNLKVHLLKHSGEKAFSCPTCSKRFARAANLKEHIKIHTGEKNYKCLICEKSFTNSSTYSKHKKIHSGEKPHTCSVCDKKFSQHAHLVKHTRIHTNEKPYSCSVCNKCFRRSDTLANHLRTHLKDDRNNLQNISVANTHSCDQMQEQHMPLSTVDVQLIQQTGETVDVPQIIYTITTPTAITGVTADQMNMELMNDTQSNPHFIITSL